MSDVKAKMSQILFPQGLHPFRPRWKLIDPWDTTALFKGSTSKGKEGKRRELEQHGKGREGERGRKGKGGRQREAAKSLKHGPVSPYIRGPHHRRACQSSLATRPTAD